MKECANEDLEIQRMRQMLDQGFDDTDVAEGTLEIHERSYNPTVDQLQDIVNRTSGVSPKNIPHLLRDGNGELYLCSADTRDVSTSLDSAGGITSAATSLRFALRWINIFELGLIDPVTWGKFQRHGEI